MQLYESRSFLGFTDALNVKYRPCKCSNSLNLKSLQLPLIAIEGAKAKKIEIKIGALKYEWNISVHQIWEIISTLTLISDFTAFI